ncbi:MAG TPA: dihydrolipoamide acetyltransferase family protein [Gaiellaceae bacterium]|nr:dihydrolipoamide acetyltransferase family protein [Gaiellaceae bacterium]
MPKLSDSMADAVIVRWLVSPGEAFERGEGLVEVETDKATVVYEAEAAGTLDAILVPEGASAAIGEPIATLANGAGSPAGAPPARERPAAAEPRPAAAAAPAPRVDGSPSERPNATPVARRTAVELGVSLHGLAGTGPGGRITREDVERAAETAGDTALVPPTTGKGEVRMIELTATQATIARRMVESATTIPVFTVSADIDLSEVVALRRGAQEEGGDVPSINDFVVLAAARTLREFPRFNASYVEGKVECYTRINVGVAVATDDALLVPVVFDADRRTLAETARETRRLAEAARSRTLSPGELHDATFTVSNLGMFGVRSFTAIIDPPQVAILAVGGLRDDVVTATLTCDHRVVYGADGARFLARLRELLERPLVLTAGNR